MGLNICLKNVDCSPSVKQRICFTIMIWECLHFFYLENTLDLKAKTQRLTSAGPERENMPRHPSALLQVNNCKTSDKCVKLYSGIFLSCFEVLIGIVPVRRHLYQSPPFILFCLGILSSLQCMHLFQFFLLELT